MWLRSYEWVLTYSTHCSSMVSFLLQRGFFMSHTATSTSVASSPARLPGVRGSQEYMLVKYGMLFTVTGLGCVASCLPGTYNTYVCCAAIANGAILSTICRDLGDRRTEFRNAALATLSAGTTWYLVSRVTAAAGLVLGIPVAVAGSLFSTAVMMPPETRDQIRQKIYPSH